MMKFLSGLFGGKREDSRAFRREMAKKLDGRAIKYVTERFPEPDGTAANDLVIGRSGALIKKNDELLVYSDEKVLFRAAIDEMTASELLSLEGVILTAPDLEHGGKLRTVIAYYTYYLKS